MIFHKPFADCDEGMNEENEELWMRGQQMCPLTIHFYM